MPPVLVFDINGTLLMTEALAPTLRAIFGPRLSVPEYFKEVVGYSMATTLVGDYRDFGEIAVSVLRMSAAAHDVTLRQSDIDRVRTRFKKLPPHPEVKSALKKLRNQGFRLAALSNSGQHSREEQLRNARLRDLFDYAISVQIVQRFKPAPEVYRGAAREMGVATRDMLMVAAHPWDLMGAARAGCRTAFVARPGEAPMPGAPAPDYVAEDLRDLARMLMEPRRSGAGTAAGNLSLAAGAATMGLLANILIRGLRQGDRGTGVPRMARLKAKDETRRDPKAVLHGIPEAR